MTLGDSNAHRKDKVRIEIVLTSDENEAYLRAKRILGEGYSNKEILNTLVRYYLTFTEVKGNEEINE